MARRQRQIDALLKKLVNVRAERDVLQNKVDEMEEAREKLQRQDPSELEGRVAEIDDLNTRLGQAEGLLEMRRGEIDTLETALQAAREQNESLEDQVLLLKKQLSASEIANDRLTVEVQKLRQRPIGESVRELAEKQRQLLQAERDNEALVVKIALLERLLKETQKKLDDLQQVVTIPVEEGFESPVDEQVVQEAIRNDTIDELFRYFQDTLGKLFDEIDKKTRKQDIGQLRSNIRKYLSDLKSHADQLRDAPDKRENLPFFIQSVAFLMTKLVTGREYFENDSQQFLSQHHRNAIPFHEPNYPTIYETSTVEEQRLVKNPRTGAIRQGEDEKNQLLIGGELPISEELVDDFAAIFSALGYPLNGQSLLSRWYPNVFPQSFVFRYVPRSEKIVVQTANDPGDSVIQISLQVISELLGVFRQNERLSQENLVRVVHLLFFTPYTVASAPNYSAEQDRPDQFRSTIFRALGHRPSIMKKGAAGEDPFKVFVKSAALRRERIDSVALDAAPLADVRRALNDAAMHGRTEEIAKFASANSLVDDDWIEAHALAVEDHHERTAAEIAHHSGVGRLSLGTKTKRWIEEFVAERAVENIVQRLQSVSFKDRYARQVYEYAQLRERTDIIALLDAKPLFMKRIKSKNSAAHCGTQLSNDQLERIVQNRRVSTQMLAMTIVTEMHNRADEVAFAGSVSGWAKKYGRDRLLRVLAADHDFKIALQAYKSQQSKAQSGNLSSTGRYHHHHHHATLAELAALWASAASGANTTLVNFATEIKNSDIRVDRHTPLQVFVVETSTVNQTTDRIGDAYYGLVFDATSSAQRYPPGEAFWPAQVRSDDEGTAVTFGPFYDEIYDVVHTPKGHLSEDVALLIIRPRTSPLRREESYSEKTTATAAETTGNVKSHGTLDDMIDVTAGYLASASNDDLAYDALRKANAWLANSGAHASKLATSDEWLSHMQRLSDALTVSGYNTPDSSAYASFMELQEAYENH